MYSSFSVFGIDLPKCFPAKMESKDGDSGGCVGMAIWPKCDIKWSKNYVHLTKRWRSLG